jgi:hypothetical protein
VFVDEVADAPRVACLGVIASAIGEAERARGVAQQRKGKAELLRESRVFRYGVETHSEYFYILGAKVSNLVAEPAALGGSPWSIGFGIKP